VLRSGEDEGASAGFIYKSLEIGEEVRCPLDFVQNSTSSLQPMEEPAWVFSSLLPVLHILQRNILKLRERGSGQGGFSRLPGAGKKNHWKRTRELS
jgi:hypothetical protein